MRTVSNSDDTIDSRDVIARIAELERERDSFEPETLSVRDLADPALAVDDRPPQTWEAASPDNAEELAALLALQADGDGYSEWQNGATLIRDSYFQDYARELAQDIGALKDDASWPYTCIDWERAARELQTDYTSVEFDGVTYWVR